PQPGRGRDDRARGERGHARGIDRGAPARVGVGAQQWHRDDITPEEAGHYRRCLLEAVDGQADVGDHRGQKGHHHIRVERRDEQPSRGYSKQGRFRHYVVGGAMFTGALKPEMSTSTAASLPPSPKAPSSCAFRIRWSETPTQTTALTSTLEVSCANMLRSWSAL